MKKLIKSISLSIVLLFTLTMLTACVPSNLNDAKEKLKEAGYVITLELGANEDEGIVGQFTAAKGSIGFQGAEYEQIIVIYFESSKEAKEYAKDWNDSIFTIKHNGKCAYAGTKNAIKDFEK